MLKLDRAFEGVGEDTASSDAVSLSRRSVVRAGAAAAWTAPLVQVLSAAPAQAVGSGVVLVLTPPLGGFSHASANKDFVFAGTLTNNGTQTTTNVQITVVLTTNGTTDWTGAAAQANTGFTASAPVTGGTSGAYTVSITYTKTAPQLAGSGGSVAVNFTIRCNTGVKSQPGSGVATATATGATPSVATGTYTA